MIVSNAIKWINLRHIWKQHIIKRIMSTSKHATSSILSGLNIKETSGGQYHIDIPGFTYADFDRHGHIATWTICKQMELNRALFTMDNIPSVEYSDSIGVVSGQIWKVNKTIYKKAAISYPMTYVHKPSHLGNNSYIVSAELVEKLSGVQLVENERNIVFIDKLTRKRVTVPTNILEAIKIKRASNFYIHTMTKPDDAYVFHMKARFSDYDHLNHVNACSYVRWIIDATSEAFNNKKLKHFNSDFTFCAEQIEVLYLNECFAGDEISVHIWEDKSNIHRIYFDVEKQKDNVLVLVVKGNIQFYTSKFASRL